MECINSPNILKNNGVDHAGRRSKCVNTARLHSISKKQRSGTHSILIKHVTIACLYWSSAATILAEYEHIRSHLQENAKGQNHRQIKKVIAAQNKKRSSEHATLKVMKRKTLESKECMCLNKMHSASVCRISSFSLYHSLSL